MSVVAITGAGGFVGRALVKRLAQGQHEVVPLVRSPIPGNTASHRDLPNLASLAAGEAGVDLSGVDILIHCAAITQSKTNMTEAERQHLFAVNVGGTAALAREAVVAGVKRFVLLSSAKVNGETTAPGTAFRADDPAAPLDDYGLSKLQAEQSLVSTAVGTSLETVIIRPPLVYGPGVAGNFRQLIKLSAKGLPLPLGGVHNRRSMIAVDNLADLIALAMDHDKAAGRILMASDGEDISTSELIARLARLQGAPVRLLSVPASILISALALMGRKGIADRLLSSFQVDSAGTRALLDWTPPLGVDAALADTISSPP
ncbi:NAD-dependent epimerase/dehydratase family protein [Devosia sediminis]|uniref:NAD-dependent epimerase/dehydratase family protein n=1 Tax=Devosia sediminis TaxID=2798801 RepID=A0A934MR57_9HYPH|nr:NAD-dependent epimerase/dehydratase family protein [Devosia sediminis]MBJ3785074.1 NAD-dependent epimerase/dehydratase family protein [Devosia sediminis]